MLTGSSETLSADGVKHGVPGPAISSTTPAGSAVERALVLEAGYAERNYWSDLWNYRELFAILAWRDIAVRYKQTVIGVAWASCARFSPWR